MSDLFILFLILGSNILNLWLFIVNRRDIMKSANHLYEALKIIESLRKCIKNEKELEALKKEVIK